MAETVLFLDAKNGLVVTSERVVVGGKEMPLQAVSTIDLRQPSMGKTLLYTIYFFAASIWLILLFSSVLKVFSGKEDIVFFYMNALPRILAAVIYLLLGILPLFVGYIIWRKKQRGANIVLEGNNNSGVNFRTTVELADLQKFVFHVKEEIELLLAETPSAPKS